MTKRSEATAGPGKVCVPLPELSPEEIKEGRERMGLSQFAFSVKYGIPVNTLRAWEQGQRTPRTTGLKLLRTVFGS